MYYKNSLITYNKHKKYIVASTYVARSVSYNDIVNVSIECVSNNAEYIINRVNIKVE